MGENLADFWSIDITRQKRVRGGGISGSDGAGGGRSFDSAGWFALRRRRAANDAPARVDAGDISHFPAAARASVGRGGWLGRQQSECS